MGCGLGFLGGQARAPVTAPGLLSFAGLWLGAALTGAMAGVGPAWWTNSQPAVLTRAAANDRAAVNAGQVKWLATNAYVHLERCLPWGAGTTVSNRVCNLARTNNYKAVNIGQLKHVAQPFYERLIAAGYTNDYPWTSRTNDDRNYAAANIGQAKRLFSFELTGDSDADGLPDWWERGHFKTLAYDGAADIDGDGRANALECALEANPLAPDADTDRDGLLDVWEAGNGLNPASAVTNGLQAWWSFENDTASTIVDDSGNGHDMAVPAAATVWQFEDAVVTVPPLPVHEDGYLPGKALRMGWSGTPVGRAYWWMDVSTEMSFNFATGFTICAWVKPEESPLGIVRFSNFEAFSYDATAGAFGLFSSEDTVWGLKINDGYIAMNAPQPQMAYGAWQHMALSVSGEREEVSLYLNGQLIKSQCFPGCIRSLGTVTAPLHVGQGLSAYWTEIELLDDVRIYSRVLAADEIAGLAEPVADPDGDGLTNQQEHQLATKARVADSDNDGTADREEARTGSNPLDDRSFPVTVAGTVSFAHTRQGLATAHVARCEGSLAWDGRGVAVAATNHAYAIEDVVTRRPFTLWAFADVNGDGRHDFWEPVASNPYPAGVTGAVTGLVMELADPNTDHDDLPDWWEIQQWDALFTDTDRDGAYDDWELAHFGNVNEPGFDDYDHDGMSNADEYRNGTDPVGTPWVEGSGHGAATLRWHARDGVQGQAYRLWDRLHRQLIAEGTVATSACAHSLTGLVAGLAYEFELVRQLSNANPCVSTGRWVQAGAGPSTDTQVWYLFPAITNPVGVLPTWPTVTNTIAGQTVTVARLPLMSRDIEVDSMAAWDRVHLANSPNGPSGTWSMNGLCLIREMNGIAEIVWPGAGTTRITVTNTAPDITFDPAGHFKLPGGKTEVRFTLGRVGDGDITLDAPLYLIKWRPQVVVE